MILRPWQEKTLAHVSTLEVGTRLCIQAPTGAGKNILLQCIAKYYLDQSKTVLLIVDRVELMKDLTEQSNKFNLKFDIYTTQKAGRRKLAQEYDVYLVDECHSKYPSVMKAILDDPNNILIGTTATAMGKGLGKIYESVYIPVTFQDLVESGTVVPPKFLISEDLINTQKLNVVRGEYDLSSLVLDRTVLDNINSKLDEHLKDGQQAMILAPNQTEAINIRKQLTCSSAIYVSDQKENFEEYKQGKIAVIITVYALSKGFNHPNIHVILDCRPLKKSCAEFIQGGRGTRTMPGKKEYLYIDMCGNYFRFEKDYNRWRLNNRVKLDKSSKECANCEYDYLKTNIPAKCTQGEHLTYDEMKCCNSKCFVDFINEDMLNCPNCKIDLITNCLKCKELVNICNRICPKCFAFDFKVRTSREHYALGIEYKSFTTDFKIVNVDYRKIDNIPEIDFLWLILKTAFYYAAYRKKIISKVAPMYASTLIKRYLHIYPEWQAYTSSLVYKAFSKHYDIICTGEYNYYILEDLKKELKKWLRSKIDGR